eukprot:COSAG04_NODE_228_length_19279_cov_89.380970_6_plen_166_part_00
MNAVSTQALLGELRTGSMPSVAASRAAGATCACSARRRSACRLCGIVAGLASNAPRLWLLRRRRSDRETVRNRGIEGGSAAENGWAPRALAQRVSLYHRAKLRCQPRGRPVIAAAPRFPLAACASLGSEALRPSRQRFLDLAAVLRCGIPGRCGLPLANEASSGG